MRLKKQPARPPHEGRRSARESLAGGATDRGELGVDLANVKGTGPEGRVTESDVRAAAKSKPAAAAAPSQAAAQLRRNQRRGQARAFNFPECARSLRERLVESKGPVPHFYLNIEIDAGPLMAARAELKSAGEDADTAKITVNDFVLKAAVMAAVKVPKVNASFDGDAIVQYADVDLGIAVAIEDGLLTPVIRAAQNKSLREISEAVKDLASRARNKRMKPEEFQGGSFTVSNLGGYGHRQFLRAIINPPQGFILAVGAIAKMPVVDDCDQIVVGHRMSIWMSCDHRVIDGALRRRLSERAAPSAGKSGAAAGLRFPPRSPDWGSTGCQPVRLAACRDVLKLHIRYAKLFPAGCRQLQAGSLRSPDAERTAWLRKTVGRGFLAAGRVRGLSGKIVSARRRTPARETRALPGSLRSAGIVTDAHRSHSAVVSQVMKSSSDSRVRATAKATTVASSRKPRKGTSSGMRSKGSTR